MISLCYKSKVPYRTALNQLNKARVNFKHFGLLPQTKDVKKFHHDIELFFHTALQEFFDIAFDEVTLTSLIKRHRVRNHLVKAEKHLEQEEFVDCVNATATAFTILFHDPFEFIHSGLSSFDRFPDRKLNDVITAIQSQLQDYQEQLNILKYNINLAEYERFKSITPHVNISIAGIIGGYRLDPARYVRSLEDARFCLRFTIDAALHLQQNPLPKNPLRGERLRKFRVIQPTVMIVYPDVQDVEEIRNAEVGEVLIGYSHGYNKNNYVAVIEDTDIMYVKGDDVEEIV